MGPEIDVKSSSSGGINRFCEPARLLTRLRTLPEGLLRGLGLRAWARV